MRRLTIETVRINRYQYDIDNLHIKSFNNSLVAPTLFGLSVLSRAFTEIVKETFSTCFLNMLSEGSRLDLMEYVSKISERDVKCYAKMILVGLVDIHKKGYIHSDLKLGNIL